MTTLIIFLAVMIAVIIGVPLYIGWRAQRPIHVPKSAYLKIAGMLWDHMVEYESRVETLEFSSLFTHNDMAIELLCEVHVSYDLVREFGTEGQYWNTTRLNYIDVVWHRVSDPCGYEMNSDFDPEELAFQINNY